MGLSITFPVTERISYSSPCCDNMPDKKQFKRRLCLGPQLTGMQSIMAAWGWGKVRYKHVMQLPHCISSEESRANRWGPGYKTSPLVTHDLPQLHHQLGARGSNTRACGEDHSNHNSKLMGQSWVRPRELWPQCPY